MRRIKNAANARQQNVVAAADTAKEEIVPMIFPPFAVGFVRTNTFGAVSQNGIGNLRMESQQVPKHMLVIRYIIVYGNNYRLRKIFQRRYKLQIRTDVARIVAYLENRKLTRQSL